MFAAGESSHSPGRIQKAGSPVTTRGFAEMSIAKPYAVTPRGQILDSYLTVTEADEC